MATEGFVEAYENEPTTEVVGATIVCGAWPGVASMSGKPLSEGMVSVVPLTDMMKLPGSVAQVDPPSEETKESKLGGGLRSEFGEAALYFHPNVPPVSPLTTTKNWEFGASAIGEPGEYRLVSWAQVPTLTLDASVVIRYNGTPPLPANNSSV
jgi:hypothetical protein